MDDVAPHVIYEFEGFEFDPRCGVLRRRIDGRTLTLTPKVLSALVYLVERAGTLVEKQALYGALWPNVVVEESNLTQTIHVLRRTLGEHPEDHRFIVTVPGRGYRFVADVATRAVQRPAQPGPPSPRRRRGDRVWRRLKWALACAVPLALIAATVAVYQARAPKASATDARNRSIAVLPFVDMSSAGSNAYFSDGLAEEVLNLLAQIPELNVAARTSSFYFRDRKEDLATIAKALDVRYLLEGTVRREVRRVRVTAQLIDASSGSHVWSAAYERDLDDVFAVQREIATGVADALETRLANPTGPRKSMPVDAVAHEDFLRGQFFYHRRAPGDLDRALHYYERSAGRDPKYARAWAGVAAITYIQTAIGDTSRETGLPRLLEAATKTVALDPGMAEGHVRLASYYHLIGEKRRAEDHFARAISLEPTNPLLMGMQAGMAAERGQFDEAIALQQRIVAAEPLSAVNIHNLGGFLFAAGRLDEAREQLLRVRELSPESGVDEVIAQILILQRNLDEARAFVEQLRPGPDRDEGLALVYHAQGRTADADAALTRLAAISATADPFRLAEVHAYRGNADQAFAWLELAARPTDSRSGVLPGARELWEMRASPILAPLHADPRWASWGRGPA